MGAVVRHGADGLAWTFHDSRLEPRPGEWDARGARVTDVPPHRDTGWLLHFSDGRASCRELPRADWRRGRRLPTTLTYARPPRGIRAGAALCEHHRDVAGSPRVHYETATEDGRITS